MPYKNPIKRKEQSKIYLKRYYEKNKERLLKQNKDYRLLNRERIAKIRFMREQELKEKVLTLYGNGSCTCIKCGFSDMRALSIDHINGGGVQHLKDINRRNIYLWLKLNNYPEGYQTLCMNCQMIKKFENGEFAYRDGKSKRRW